MNQFLKFLLPIGVLLLLQSCDKYDREEEIIIEDHFNYASRFNFREDSIRKGGGKWENIQNGNLFTWLSDDLTLGKTLQRPGGFATYLRRTNLKANFIYSIAKDSVFTFRLSKDSIYFLDEGGRNRTDLNGQLIFATDTSLILHNTAESPAVSIKYKLER